MKAILLTMQKLWHMLKFFANRTGKNPCPPPPPIKQCVFLLLVVLLKIYFERIVCYCKCYVAYLLIHWFLKVITIAKEICFCKQ